MRRLTTVLVASAVACSLAGVAGASDRTPLVGSSLPTQNGASSVNPVAGTIVAIDPSLVSCEQIVNFTDVVGGPAPGTNYDLLLSSGGMLFGERFAGQTTGSIGDFDLISGTPANPLHPAAGAAGRNLDVFDYAGNVLTGLGPLGYPDIDAIGEGSISMAFPVPVERVKLDIVGGNGGSATLSFYRADGSHIDDVMVSGLADLTYAFETSDATSSIAGILVQNTDASGIGIVNICYNPGVVKVQASTWGSLKQLYR